MFESISKLLSSGISLMAFMVGLPLFCGFLIWLFRKNQTVKLAVALSASILDLLFALSLYLSIGFKAKIEYAPFGFEFSFHVNELSALFLVITAVMFVLISLYTVVSLKNTNYGGLYIFYLFISFALVNGALLSGGLGTVLFFWEGLLCVLFAILLIGNKDNPKTAVKALTVSGLSVLTLMLGIILTTHVAETAEISEISVPLTGLGLFSFLCVILGALGQIGCMPLHSWIPDAADDAPTPFLAAFPGALQAILGTYLAVIAVRDIFDFKAGSGVSILVITLGLITVVFGAAMALVQKDLKRLLAYTAISMSGFIAMGFGTGTDSGISGGIYALLNYVIIISGLAMICGIVEKKTGTTDLKQLKGLGKKMPAIAVCFGILALSAVGFPFFGGFYSIQLILGSVLETSVVLYICAFIGLFLLTLNFFRTGRSLFLGEYKSKAENDEADSLMNIPVYILSAISILLCYNPLPLDRLIKPALNTSESFAGFPDSVVTIIVAVAVLIIAVIDHIYGYKKSGNALDSFEHISKAPVIKTVYSWAEKGYLDPYKWILGVVGGYSIVCTRIEHGVSWVYDKGVPGLVKGTGNALHRFDNGRLSRYLYLVVGGLLLLLIIFLIII